MVPERCFTLMDSSKFNKPLVLKLKSSIKAGTKALYEMAHGINYEITFIYFDADSWIERHTLHQGIETNKSRVATTRGASARFHKSKK